MIRGSRVVFIVGFERCLTSSLATYLVQNGYCSLLVEGLKEPKVFSSDRALAAAIVDRETRRRQGWLLDASVNYITNPAALAAIRATVEDCRIIVCMRNQFVRTVSAFQLYQGIFTRDNASASWLDWPFNIEFGDHELRTRSANDPLAPPKLRAKPLGRYVFTAMAAFAEGLDTSDQDAINRYDRAVEDFRGSSLSRRVLTEMRYWARTGEFPLMSILINTYFAWCIEELLSRFDPREMLFVTLASRQSQERLDQTLGSFIGVRTRTGNALPRVLPSRQFAVLVSARDRQTAEQALRPSLEEDTRKTLALLAANSELDLSLFAPDALYPEMSPAVVGIDCLDAA